ncbi:chromate transporter [Tetragenococcus halophilus]|uniref:chromate transporter n=1 Tax=Tetragenococcus halophilus TaxID=51669 RepID=UPI000CBD581D|nr:chromate transporter [Tetragenococcus halophilus]RQD33131.1 chromate transporter [Tetragenococcus halophilus subsp. halophilus DSM 20339]GBD60266.1 putative chromate transport protein [Tetragenococcus halophilus subsp. halophilus]GFK22323.1 putative chromate transport protein [Tetragenococcus halophilus]GMA43843.1 chromate transporter [Tetragenococcus halophilus subsp. halophilus DSM 20339]GMG61797.1 chromate transporter [Tetragenococcus halophilus]
MIYLQLFYEFFKTGLFSVGGGLATLPFLYDMSDRTGWFSNDQLADMIAISESTPGAIGINMATYAGNLTAGAFGGIVATVGLVTPAMILIIIIGRFLTKFRNNFYVESVFYGLRPASTALIAAAGFSVVWMDLFDVSSLLDAGDWLGFINWKSLILAIFLFFIMRHRLFKNLHPVIFIALSALVGIVFQFAG